MVGRRETRPGLDDRRRDAESGIDLGQLAAGRTAAEDDQAARQLAGQRRLLVGPGDAVVEALDRGSLGHGADGDDDVRAGQLVGHLVVADGDPATPRDRGAPAVDDGSGLGQRLDVRAVVGFGRIGRAG